MAIRYAFGFFQRLSKMSYPSPYIVEPQLGHTHTTTVILLHGRSSTAREFASDLFALTTSGSKNLPVTFPNFRWVFPDAGERRCTLHKEKLSAWCDTFSLDDLSLRQDLQVEGLRGGVLHVKSIIEDETERLGGRSDKIILGGFSQGSATALWSLFSGAAASKGLLGGFIGIGAWMPFTREVKRAVAVEGEDKSQSLRVEKLTSTMLEILGIDPLVSVEEVKDCLRKTPIFLGHGTDDTIVSVANCHDLAAIFHALEVELSVQEYTGAANNGHWVKEPEQLDSIVAFLTKVKEC